MASDYNEIKQAIDKTIDVLGYNLNSNIYTAA